MRTPLICGNWKLHKTVAETRAFLAELLPRVEQVEGVEIGLAPTFTALADAADALADSPVMVGAQNVHWEESGAFTGEVSVAMLREAGCAFAIVGHSERRQYFGESDETVGLRARAAHAGGLLPIICVGETLQERQAGKAQEVVSRQLDKALDGFDPEALGRLVIAYEPVWAIGTGQTATAAQAQQMHRHIRERLEGLGGEGAAGKVRIIYGGSVKPDNVAELMAQPDVDGALVGGASLDAETFASLMGFRV